MEVTIDKSLHRRESGGSSVKSAMGLDDELFQRICQLILRTYETDRTETHQQSLSAGETYHSKYGSLTVEVIAGDGSDRRFFRVIMGANRFVVMHSAPENSFRLKENMAFDYLSSHLALRGIPVPKIYFVDTKNGFFVMEDLGNQSLYSYIMKHPKRRNNILRKAIHLLATFHESAGRDIDSSFFIDGAFYCPEFVLEKELEYFRRSFLCDFLGLRASWGFLRDDFGKLAELAGTYDDSSCIHRDFQSRNIMLKKGSLRIIDYQGMRYGPCEYDLAALLIDPYVGIPPQEHRFFIQQYSNLRKGLSPDRYEVVSLCRNLQILAAFAFLGAKKGKRFFLTFIPRAWEGLVRKQSTVTRLGLRSLAEVLNMADHRMKMARKASFKSYVS